MRRAQIIALFHNPEVFASRFAASVILALWCQAEWFGWGNGTVSKAFDVFQSVTYMTVCFFFFAQGKWLRLIVVAVSLLALIGWPLHGMVGPLVTIANAETVLGTSFGETTQFLSTVAAGEYVLPGILALVVWGFLFIPWKSVGIFRKSLLWYGLIIVLCSPIFIKITGLNNVLLFVGSALWSPAKTMTWQITGTIPDAPKVKNYIIVMGESLRKDALHLYGNPYPTTPFLDSVPVKMIRTPVSPAGATMYAVPRELALTTGKGAENVEPENNVVALANAAGMRTYWLSSHERVLNKGIPFAIVADSAQKHYYAEKANDFLLVKEFERILREEPTEKSRFLVVNTYGSHEPVCERVKNFGKPFSTGVKGKDWAVPFLGNDGYFDCYLASALKADRVIEGLVKASVDRGETYALIFTSDHANTFFFKDGEMKCCRFPEYKSLYDVPFIELGTHVRTAAGYLVTRETARLSDYVPTWLGLKTNRTPENYDIFTAPSDVPYVSELSGKITRYADELDSLSMREVLSGKRP